LLFIQTPLVNNSNYIAAEKPFIIQQNGIMASI